MEDFIVVYRTQCDSTIFSRDGSMKPVDHSLTAQHAFEILSSKRSTRQALCDMPSLQNTSEPETPAVSVSKVADSSLLSSLLSTRLRSSTIFPKFT